MLTWQYSTSAGCPTAVANLWDVTDMDIDRFSRAVLEAWLPESMEGASSAKNNARDHLGKPLCVSITVSRSRRACKLQYLIGAAPVCYGVPLSVLR